MSAWRRENKKGGRVRKETYLPADESRSANPRRLRGIGRLKFICLNELEPPMIGGERSPLLLCPSPSTSASPSASMSASPSASESMSWSNGRRPFAGRLEWGYRAEEYAIEWGRGRPGWGFRWSFRCAEGDIAWDILPPAYLWPVVGDS